MLAGDILITQDGEESRILSITAGSEYDFVYNLEVSDFHTYIAEDVRVHNGGGGKGGSQRTPVEAPDSLRSKQFARVLDLVSEGEIRGLVDGLRSVYLNDTPVQNADGSYNFTGVSLGTRNGTQNQPSIPGYGAVEAETGVGTEIKANEPIVRTITNASATAVRITVSVPQLTSQNIENGDLSGTSVALALDIQSDGGGFIQQNLSVTYNSAGVIIADGIATNTIPNNLFQASVTFQRPAATGDGFFSSVIAPQGTIGYLLQYRLVGASAWTDYRSGIYDSRARTSASGGLASIFGSGKFSLGKSLSATDGLSLPQGSYNFRVIKTSGSQEGVNAQGSPVILTGIQYGGSVYISSLLVSQPQLGDTISGKTTSRYQRSYRLNLTGTGPWDIRVRRLTADSTSVALVNATYWDSYTEIVEAQLTYPNSALVSIAIDSEKFGAIPSRGYELWGLLVKVPSNYDPVLRSYTGIWNGTFKLAWTNNPAWCFYDLLLSKRYGLGDFINTAQVDKWSLYQIAQYCDERVLDGYGGIEPRFTCNLYLQTREEAYSVITSFASIFCGMAFWGAGSISAIQDAPAQPSALFTPANVIEGQFNYSGSSAKTRHTVALISWNDPEDRYRQKIEYVEDLAGIAKYGIVQTEIVALGCTSRGQALRYGRRILYTERMETETVTFRTGLEGLAVSPGEVIQTSDPVRAGTRMGGRLLGTTETTANLDSTVTIALGNSYTLWVVLPDGTVESRAVTNIAEDSAILTVSPAFSATPQVMSMWVLAASNLVPETWRVIAIAEAENSQADITALKYTPGKYDEIEKGIILEPLSTSILNTSTQAAPTDLSITEQLYLVTRGIIGTSATVSWSGNASRYELQYRIAGGNWVTVTSNTPSTDIRPLDPGTYEFILIAFSALGKRSLPVVASKIIYGKSSPPDNLTLFNLAAINGTAQLSFSAATNLDVTVGGYLRIRHSTDTLGPTWTNSLDIGSRIPGAATTAVLPLIAGVYLAKWVDSSGNESAQPLMLTTTAPSVIALNAVESRIEHPNFTGPKTNGVVVDGTVILDSGAGVVFSSGEYLFPDTMDLGNVHTSRLTGVLNSQSYDASDLISARPLISTWRSVTGDVITDVSCTVYVRITNTDPLASPDWSAWEPFVVGDYTARAFQFKAVLTSDYPTHNIEMTALSVTVDMPDRIESRNDLISGTTGYNVAYSRPFVVSPALGITAQNMATGDYYVITGKSATGFTVNFKNSANAAISRTFDYVSKGY